MSIKDRIKFFENLKNNQDTKPSPKPLPNKLPEKKPEVSKPVTDQSIKPIKLEPKPNLSVSSNQAPLHQIPKPIPVQIPQKQPTKQVSKKQNELIQPKELSPQQPPKLLLAKSAQVITHPQSQKQPNSQNKNPQKEGQKEESSVINVKNLRNMFEKKEFPIVQQPPIMKSCFVPKKSPFKTKQETEQQEEALKPKQERTSLPQKTESNEAQKKLTFQEMRMIAESLFSKTRAPPAKPQQQEQSHEQKHEEPQPTTEISEPHNDSVKVQPGHEAQKDQNGKNEQKDQIFDSESKILFKEALKHQPEISNNLVTGQSNNLNLTTRKTVARKRNDSDDFDDL